MKKQAVIYCRVSTKEQVQNLSLPTQRARCTEYCTKQGWEVATLFEDAGESAKTQDRPAFQDMIRYCKAAKGQVQYVVVYSLSRFSRNVEDSLNVLSELRKTGVQLRSVTEAVDDSAVGKLQRIVTAAFDEYDNNRKAERTIEGMTQAAKIGRWPFKAPLGYRNVMSQDGPNLIPDPERAPLVRKAFELFATGTRTKQEVLRLVTQLGLRKPDGKALSAQSFDNLLRNPIYAGWIVIPSWDIRAKGSFVPLVSDETLRAVQNLLKGKMTAAVPHKRNNPDFPLRVFVRCDYCNEPLTGSWSKGRKQRYAYYRCRNGRCLKVKIAREKLEKAFVAFLERLQPNPSTMTLLREMVKRVWCARQKEAVALFQAASSEMRKLDERKQLLIDALLYRKIDQTTYDQQLEKLRVDLDAAEARLQEAELEQIDVEEVLAYAEQVLLHASTLWSDSALNDKQRLQSVFFPHGVTFSSEGFGTAESPSIFSMLRESEAEISSLASPTGFEPVLPP